MSSKCKIEGVTKGGHGGHGGHDPLRRSSVKGVTGGHDYLGVTPVTPQSGGHEPISEKTSETYLERMIEGVPVDAQALAVVGQVTERNGQRYLFTGGEAYTNKVGDVVDLLSLHSRCCDCGTWFKFKTTARTKYWNMRCPPCIRGKRAGA